MTARNSTAGRPRVVGVIASNTDLDRAMRMRKLPDLFELRLDCFARTVDQLENKVPRFRTPLIITARHPQEGGANKLSPRQRRDLLTRFLDCADYIDVELRSVSAMRSLLRLAQRKKVGRIISFHNFKSTPSARILAAKARSARARGANIFKVATRIDTPTELARLLDFITKKNLGLRASAMGIGKLGAISRILLARAGSALVYASIGAETGIEGQLSLDQLRALGIASRC
jgi:3-dehydroquinate dehydratase-1